MSFLSTWKHRCVGALLIGILGWQAGAAVVDIAQLGTRPELAPWSLRLAADDDARLRALLGRDHAAYRAVVDHVPPGVWVVLDCDPDAASLRLASYLLTTLYPRRVIPQGHALRMAESGDLLPGDPCFVLSLAPRNTVYQEGHVREVARGERYTLYERRRPQ